MPLYTSLTLSQVTGAGTMAAEAAADYATIASPALTGDPTAPTAAVGDDDTSVATTEFVGDAIAASVAAPSATEPPLSILLAALSNRNVAPCRIVFAGSSTTVGTGASDTAHSYVGLLVAGLQNAYPSDTGSEASLVASTTATWGTPSSAHGVHGFNMGEGGTTSANYFTSGERTSTAAIAPTCIVHMIGANDFSTGVDPATYKTNVLAVVNGLKALITTPLVQVLAHTYQRMDVASPAYPWSDYRDALQEIAEADPDNVVFVDSSAVYAAEGVPGSNPLSLIGGDNIHQGDAGHFLTAELLWRSLVESPRTLASSGSSLALTLTVAPAITGTAEVGEELSVSAGTWSATPDWTTYQWLRDGVAIGSATASTYTLVESDGGTDVSCAVSVSAAGYQSAAAISNAVAVTTPVAGVVVSDTFTRADGALGTCETPATAWTIAGGTWAIASNTAYLTGSAGLATIDSGITDYTIAADVIQNGAANPAGVTFRVVNSSTRLTACFNAAAVSIWMGAVQVASVADTINVSVSHNVSAAVSGNQIDVSLDDVAKVSYTISGGDVATFASATVVGMRCNGTGVTFDNFTVTAL